MYKSTEVYEMNSPCNAKDELLRVLGEASKLRPEFIVKCADITIKACTKRALEQFGEYQDPNPVAASLKIGHFTNDAVPFNNFLDKLNTIYDCGFGGQELFGTVWLHDGTWLSRSEYDGSEDWFHHKSPKIPEDLL